MYTPLTKWIVFICNNIILPLIFLLLSLLHATLSLFISFSPTTTSFVILYLCIIFAQAAHTNLQITTCYVCATFIPLPFCLYHTSHPTITQPPRIIYNLNCHFASASACHIQHVLAGRTCKYAANHTHVLCWPQPQLADDNACVGVWGEAHSRNPHLHYPHRMPVPPFPL